MAQINPRTFADAKQLGDNVYELILTNWGNRGLAQDSNNGSISYPPVKNVPGFLPNTTAIPILGEFTLPPIPSLAAIAIAPRSDLDRCILNFASLPQTAPELSVDPGFSIEEGFVDRGGILQTEQILAVSAPLIGQLLGPIIIRAHSAHWFGDTYILSDGLGTSKPFGTALNQIVNLVNPDRPLWTNPQLRLLLYLNGRAALPPTIRAPFHAQRVWIFSGATEELMMVVPVMGRKYVRVTFHSDTDDIAVRITGTFYTLFRPGIFGDINPNDWEVPLIGPTTVLEKTSETFTCNCELVHTPLSYLLVKAKSQVLRTCRFTIDAYD
jgi:hypothetical protein